MIYFTKYAEQKFDILAKHKVYFRREQIEECLNLPEKEEKKGNYQTAQKEGLKVIFKKEEGVKRVITFYPV